MKSKKTIKRYMPCPVCGDYYFIDEARPDGEEDFCTVCGWYFDKEQANNPDKKQGRNNLSLNEYKKWFEDQRKANPKFDYLKSIQSPDEPHKCPVCGEYTFKDIYSHDICPICGWEDDGSDERPNSIGGANKHSLIESKTVFQSQRKTDPKYRWENKKILFLKEN